MFRVSTVRRVALELVPVAVFVGGVGVVLDHGTLARALLLPVLVWAAMAAQYALRVRAEEKVSKVEAGLTGGWWAFASIARGYFRLGLWRGRGIYDFATLVLFGCGLWWWLCVATGDRAGAQQTRWFVAAALVPVVAGAWLRVRAPRFQSALMHDVYAVLDGWSHRRSRVDEAAYENAVADHLARESFVVQQGARLDTGREADIVVRPKDHYGAWDHRDVMIEMKAHMTSTNERDRAMGQIETYARDWSGGMILMICGRYRDELLLPIREKISAMAAGGVPVALVVKGRAV